MDLNRQDGPSPTLQAAVDDMFDYKPWNEDQKACGLLVRETFAAAVRIIVSNVPPCPDRSTAIRKLREARMDCNSAISHKGKY